MNANLFRKEWKRGRTALLLWTAVLSVFTVLTMAFYPSIAENAAQIGALLESPMMKTMLEMFGGADMHSFTDILGFYATKNIATLLLLGSIFSIIVASTIVAREENEKTADFLLTRPVTRTEVHLTKTAVWLSMVIVLNVIHAAVGFATLEIFQGEAPRKMELTPAVTANIVDGLQRHPEKIGPFFDPSAKMYDDLMVRRLVAEIKTGREDIAKAGVSSEALEELTAELAAGPENLLRNIKANPDRYMMLLNIAESRRLEFMREFEQAEAMYYSQKEAFRTNPAVFTEMFKADPEYFMQRYNNDRAGLDALITEFSLDSSLVRGAFTAYNRISYCILSVYGMLVMIAFGGIGLFLSILIKRGRPVSNAGIALVLAMYFLDALAKTVEQINFLGYISPFKYVNVSVLEPAYGLEAWRLAYLLLVPAILIGASLFFYRRKDIIV